jgi:prevent-host-death family protein
MRAVNIHEAKTHLSRLVEQAVEGRQVVIAKAGKPVARLVAVKKTRKKRTLGFLAGKLRIPKDFDAPLPEDVIAEFEGPSRASAS